jgi:predicted nucleotidyltransferase
MPGSARWPGPGGAVLLDLLKCDPGLLQLADAVVGELLTKSNRLRAADIMIVGASCRDILQSALDHDFDLRATGDIDLGLAVANWAAYDELIQALPVAGKTGIRYQVAGVPADLMPFGAVEDPPGMVTPAARREPMSVWGFAEVFEAALPFVLPGAGAVRIPTVAGYAALKLVAWLDRSAYGEYKDASDLATAVYWYAKSPEVETRLYDTDAGQDVLLREEADDSAAAAHVLGMDIVEVIGAVRATELAGRWPESRHDLLYPSMTVTNAPDWTRSSDRRRELVRALERGLGIES